MMLNIRVTIILAFCTLFMQGQQVPFDCAAILDPNESHRTTANALNSSSYSGSVDPEYLDTFPPISFDVFFWIINKSDGTNDEVITEQNLLDNLKKTNEMFSSMGICFVLKGYDYINENNIYQNSSYYNIKNYAQNNNHVIPNSFNVYIPKSMSAGNGATEYGSNMLAVNQSHILGVWEIVPGNALAHEFGHVFNLFHPWGAANGTIVTQEHVTRDPLHVNYNALNTADYIHDTSAMASFWTEANYFGLTIFDIVDVDNCTYTGSLTDQLGVPFNLNSMDVGNAMAYTWSPCIGGFTTGQGIRIREYIANPAHSNVLSVLAMRSNYPQVDLYIKDSGEDFGEEPNLSSTTFWNTEDIWIRHQEDFIIEHQNPEYDPLNPNFIHVRIRNRGCSASTGSEQVKVYWSKAATSLSWDYHWDGTNVFGNGALVGGEIGIINLPVIEANEDLVVALPWSVPNPADYSTINQEPWHFCILARVISNDDPMTFNETSVLGYNVRFNNNIAQKNLTVVDFEPNSIGTPIGGVIAVGNLYNESRKFTLEFVADSNETGKRIFEEAEVSINLDSILLEAWVRGGSQGTNVQYRGGSKLIVTGDNAQLHNLDFSANKVGTLNLMFNFLTKEITSKDEFSYNVIQIDDLTNDVIGGETYKIRKFPRNLFFANAGVDKETDKDTPVTLNALVISEPALYNWYDTEGNLIFEGVDFTVSTDVGKKYKLEVIALSDGYKDYSEVEVKLKPNSITSIFPNPSSTEVTLMYKINEGNSAYLSVNSIYDSSGLSYNYVLDIIEQEIIVDLSNYPQGLYAIALIVNGEISDTTTLIKQ